MREGLGGCKVCGKRMLTNRSPLIRRTCDACKAGRQREANRATAARRKAERHAAKAAMEAPRCERCGKAIEGANRLNLSHRHPRWARRFCGNTCRQGAFHDRHG